MHIPDGLMDPWVALIGWAEFLIAIAFAARYTAKDVNDRNLPRIAVLSAGIFVAQMLNFPIGGGTTGHLVGGALFAILAGPAIAVVGMTIILIIQGLLFGDGGLTALGLNALNMAVIAPLAGWGIYTLLGRLPKERSNGWETAAVAVASWTSVFLAAAACAAELLVSYAISGGAYGIAGSVAVPAMLGYHALIGVGEAAITVGVITYVRTVSPEMFSLRKASAEESKGMAKSLFASRTVLGALAIIVVFAAMIPFYIIYSSEGEDGLERTMSESGVEEGEPLLNSPFSYGETYFQILLAGIIGFAAVLAIVAAVLGLARTRGSET
ncbi:MAG: energy-coupling factor ABC transporter permease [Thermoplasmata archaeon]